MGHDLTDLNEERAAALVIELLRQLEEARAAVEESERRAGGFRRMISGLVEMFPALEDLLPEDIDPERDPRPRGVEAVRRVLDDKPGEWHRVHGVVEMLSRRGWLPESSNPANAVRTALERAVDANSVKKSRTAEGAVIYGSTKPTYDDEEPF